ncbi:MAG TPA: hypothetical protein ENI74_02995 [Gammaproteobacteria bacterium]|nr:hypothetical protein [Gammaproteobacteria bacterium]
MASGFALIEQSASQQGNAFAGGSAVANDASTIYFNPAGMTRLKRQAVVGAHLIITSAKFDGSGTDPAGFPTSGGNGGDAGGNGVVPNLYFSTPLGDGLFAGIGINVPFGLSTKYDGNWKGRYQAIESEVKTININPSLAYKVNNHFSVGVGISLQYIDAKLTQNIDQGSLCVPTLAQLQALGAPGADPANCTGLVPQGSDGFAKVEGDNWAGGFNLGLLYEPTNSTRIGLAYRSKVNQQLTGKARFKNTIPQLSPFGLFVKTGISADINLPQTASLSIYHDVNTRWSVMADATWTGWDNFDELRIKFDSNQPDTVVDENWNDVWRYSLGVDFRVNSAWTLRAGTAFDKSPISDSNRTARIPGEDRIWASAGVGYQMTQSIGIDVGYSHLFIDDPKLRENSPTTGTLTGDYKADVNIISAQLVWDI